MIRALLLAVLLPAAALALDLPEGAETLADVTRPDADLQLATGPFRAGAVPAEVLSGTLRQQGFRLPPGSSAALIEGLVADLQAEGATLVYACAARDCGGFDFRFSLDLLPAPQMHVDLADYRYAALRGMDGSGAVLVASRAGEALFLQVSTLTPGSVPATITTDVTTAPISPTVPAAIAAPGEATAFVAALEASGALVLQDVAFASGAAALADPAAPSLRLLTDYLSANPTRTIAIVGHTDASGRLDGNIALSRQRAQAVRAALVDLGADGTRIAADGVGFLAPRASNLTEAGRQQNRRVEVMLTSTD